MGGATNNIMEANARATGYRRIQRKGASMMDDLISREATVSILRARADMALGDVKDAASFF